MNPSLFLKNLPAPLQFLVRPMLLISLALHGLLLAVPIPSEKKAEAPKKKEPEKVKITQLPTTSSPPAPVASPRITPKPSPLVSQPKPSPIVRQPTVTQPSPIRQRSSDVPPIPPITRSTRSIPRPAPSPSPSAATPSPSPSVATPSPSLSTAAPTPSPLAADQTATPTSSPSTTTPSPSTAAPTSPQPSPAPTQNSNLQNPYADFPFPANAQLGSLGLLSGETDKSARNTPNGLAQVVSFYNTELPAKQFNPPEPLNDTAEIKVFRVSKQGAEPQYLHLISQQGKTVIVLASQEIKDLNTLKSAEGLSPEELAFNSALDPIKKNEDLGSVDDEVIGKIPAYAQFADPNKFLRVVATTTFKPKSTKELFDEVNLSLVNAGFKQITAAGSYGGGQVYKVTQGNFTRYLYFVVNGDNKTIMFVSKEPPV